MKYADLHVHTCDSDGTFTPEQLVKHSLERALSAIGIVDHDTVSAIPRALEAAKGTDLEVIPGIELTAQYENQEVHILGYFINFRDAQLLDKLKTVQLNRVERIHKIVNNLEGQGISLNAQTVFDISGKGTVGRMHIARALVKEGWVATASEAFSKYIGDKSPAYVAGFSFSPAEAIALIRSSGAEGTRLNALFA